MKHVLIIIEGPVESYLYEENYNDSVPNFHIAAEATEFLQNWENGDAEPMGYDDEEEEGEVEDE